MNLLYSLVAVAVLVAFAAIGAQSAALRPLLAVVLPYAAVLFFVVGVAWRVMSWARSPVPFRITTTTGQQKSLPWLKASPLDNPSSFLGVVGRMALEILFFRSLFRNTKAELRSGPQLAYGENKYLWLAAMAFHWSFLIILLRHLRFFTEPIPAAITGLAAIDGFFQVGVPVIYATSVFVLAGLGYLLVRRLLEPQLRYISLFADYFVLLLLIGITGSGVLMRYFTRVDVVSVKELAMGLVTFQPVVPATVGAFFFVHLLLLSALVAWFPFSKLMHMVGIFLSPTRNLANDNRMKRHVNPWNYPVKVHTYEEWEEEFRDKLRAAGLPIEKDVEHV
jgi:nitrate reductase gamma subunit